MLKIVQGRYEVYDLAESVQKSICIDTSKFYHIYNNNDKMNVIYETGAINDIEQNEIFWLLEILNKDNSLKHIELQEAIDEFGQDVYRIEKEDHSYIVVNKKDVKELCEMLTKKGHQILQ